MNYKEQESCTTICQCEPNYEVEYHKYLEKTTRLTEENERLKEALIKIALRL